MLSRPPRTPRTLSALLEGLSDTWVVHDLGHLGQVVRVMAKQYAEAIGPRRQFLPIVTDRPVAVA